MRNAPGNAFQLIVKWGNGKHHFQTFSEKLVYLFNFRLLMDKDNRLIEQIKSGNQRALATVYKQYKKEFLLYAARFSLDREELLDIYQDAIVSLYDNIISGKLESLSSSLKTYLFSIGKYQIYNRRKAPPSPEGLELYEHRLYSEEEKDHLWKEEHIEKLQKAYISLGGKCREVLKMFYYDNLSIAEIKDRLGYTSKDVVKSQKSRCLKQLKETVLRST